MYKNNLLFYDFIQNIKIYTSFLFFRYNEIIGMGCFLNEETLDILQAHAQQLLGIQLEAFEQEDLKGVTNKIKTPLPIQNGRALSMN